jgi:hypothetical protein
MGTVKLNNDVRTSVRGELGSSPRILLWTTQNRPILPGFKRDCSLHAGRGQTKKRKRDRRVMFSPAKMVSSQTVLVFPVLAGESGFRRRVWRFECSVAFGWRLLYQNATRWKPCAIRV